MPFFGLSYYSTIEKQFETNFKKFAEGIFRYSYFKVSDYELARDITEETFVKYWKRLKNGSLVHNHQAFLYFIAKGLIIDYYRTKKNRKLSLEIIDERLLSTIDNTEDNIAKKQELDQVYKAIKKLKKEYQDILFLHFVEDITIKEIAYIQDKKENALRVQMHRALKELKKIL